MGTRAEENQGELGVGDQEGTGGKGLEAAQGAASGHLQ